MGRTGRLGTTVRTRSRRVVSLALVMVMLVPAFAQASPSEWRPDGDRITPPVPSSGFGDMSMSGDAMFMAVAAPSRYTGDYGEVFVYRRSGSNWIQVGNTVEGAPIDNYPSSHLNAAISDDGQTLIVGSELANNQGGIARVYRFDGQEWRQVGSDLVGERPATIHLGQDVSISADGSIVAVGAGGFSTAGYVTVFQIVGDELVQLGNHVVGDFQDFTGKKIALSDDGRRLIFSAGNTNQHRRTQVRVYEFDGAEWNQLGSTRRGTTRRDGFGFSIAISGNGETIVVGAPDNYGDAESAGYARVFQYNGTHWVQVGSDLEGEELGDRAGFSVAVDYDGSTIAVGAPHNDGAGLRSGHTRVFEFSGGDWAQLGPEIDGQPTDKHSGKWIAITDDGATVAVAEGDYFLDGSVQAFTMAESTTPFNGGDVVSLVNEGSGRYLDSDGVHRSWNVDTSLDQRFDARWRLVDNGDGTWALLNRRRTRYLDADGSNAAWNVNQSVLLEDDDKWEIIEDDGSYVLRNVALSRYLHQADDGNVVTADAVAGDFSRWQIQLVRD